MKDVLKGIVHILFSNMVTFQYHTLLPGSLQSHDGCVEEGVVLRV